MLYDFYKYQNALRANSIHATYLVYGTKGSDNCLTNGDVEMSSSMPEDETSEDVATITLSLVGEQNLMGKVCPPPVALHPLTAISSCPE